MNDDLLGTYKCHRCNHSQFMHREGACDGIDEWEEDENSSECPCVEFIDHKDC